MKNRARAWAIVCKGKGEEECFLAWSFGLSKKALLSWIKESWAKENFRVVRAVVLW